MEHGAKTQTDIPTGFLLLLVLIILTWAAFGVYITSGKKKAPTHDTDIANIQQKQIELEKKIDELAKAKPADSETSNTDLSQIIADSKQRELELASLKTELAAITDRAAALEAKLADVNTNLQESGSQENSNNLMISAMRLRDSVIESRNFETDLILVKAFVGDNPEIADYIKILDNNSKGTTPISELRDEFRTVSVNILKLARIQKENPTLIDKAVLHFSKIVQVMKIDATARGDNPEDIIARTYNYLQKNDLASAVKEMNSLPPDAKDIADDWLKKAEANINTKEAAEEIFLIATRPVMKSASSQ